MARAMRFPVTRARPRNNGRGSQRRALPDVVDGGERHPAPVHDDLSMALTAAEPFNDSRTLQSEGSLRT